MKKFKNKKSVFLINIIIQIFVLLTLLFSYKNEIKVIDIKPSEWESEFIHYKDNEWYVDSSYQITVDDPKVLIHKPHLNLEKGTYSIIIDYDTEEDQECCFPINYENVENNYIKERTGILSKNKTNLVYNFEITEDVRHLDFAIMYNGRGNFAIKDISIVKNSRSSICLIRNIMIAFILIDICWLFILMKKEYKRIALSLLLISFVSSLLLFTTGDGGDDFLFHIIRMEGILQEIKNGQFPVYLSSFWLDGYGYPVSIYYGDLLLYFPVILRLIGFSITEAYKVFLFFINLGTAAISYFSFKKIFKSDLIGMIISLVYTTATYRLTNVYIRAAVGEFCAMMFMPVIALAIYQIYQNDVNDWKSYKRNVLLLAIGMTGIIQSHTLSAEMVVFVLFVICLVMLKKTLRLNTLRVYFEAVIVAILFNFQFLVPFLDCMIHDTLEVNLNLLGKSAIQHAGASIAQIFSFFTIYGKNRALTPGLILMGGLILMVIYIFYKKKDKQLIFYVSFAIATIILSSNVFPWNYLSTRTQVFRYLSSIQFPWRFLGVSVLFLSLGLGRLLKLHFSEGGDRKRISLTIVVITFLMLCYYSGQHLQFANLTEYYDDSNLITAHVVGGEYLLPNADLDEINGKIEYQNISYLEVLDHRGSMYELWVDSGQNNGIIKLPLFNYSRYQVIDMEGNSYPTFSNDYGEMCFEVPSNFEGIILIEYKKPRLWKISEIVSAISFIFFAFNLFIERYGRIKSFTT